MRIIERVLDGVVVHLSERELELLEGIVELHRLLDSEEAEAQEAGRVSQEELDDALAERLCSRWPEGVLPVEAKEGEEYDEDFDWASDAWERDQER